MEKYMKMVINVIIFINLLKIMKNNVIDVVEIIFHFYALKMNNILDKHKYQCAHFVEEIILYFNVLNMLVIKHYIIIEMRDKESKRLWTIKSEYLCLYSLMILYFAYIYILIKLLIYLLNRNPSLNYACNHYNIIILIHQ